MNPHCSRCFRCGRFMKRITEGVGLPLSTGFPPARDVASNTPYAPFMCLNHGQFGHIEYHPVTFEVA